jgi:hypothetical protein
MNLNIIRCTIIFFLLVLSGLNTHVFSQTPQQQALLEIQQSENAQYLADREEVLRLAEQFNLPLRIRDAEGRMTELIKFRVGYPVYAITTNAGGAELIKSDKVYPGGGAGLQLTGAGQTLGVWDAGRVRAEHQEFTGRVTQMDGATNNNGHATHVAGTMMAEGVNSDAKGMSFEADLHAYDWNNDNAEMASAAAGGLRVSQHSYGFITGWAHGSWSGNSGWHWFGNSGISEEEDYLWGFYNSNSQSWDNIAHNAPHYLIVKSAGNDRGHGPSPGTEHYVWVSGSGWELSTEEREKDGGDDGYDVISHNGLAKNIMTVGAVTSSGSMSNFSAWGPTDDGRIKPDIVAKGVGVTSPTAQNNSSYGTWSGTSMSGPMISGSVGLLLEHQENIHPGQILLSSTIKGLIIHSADDEIGGNPGPDYEFGWGLMDTESATEVMSRSAVGDAALVYETQLSDSDEFELEFIATGDEPLRATLVWTDVPGTPVAPQLNPTDLMLVNDLDMRLEDDSSVVYYPYILDPDNPSDSATTGDNFRDNIEMIHIETPDSGMVYTLKINHKGNLSGGSQEFSLILTGGNLTGLNNYDIGVTAVNAPDEFICDSIFETQLNVFNFGDEVIESFYVHYQLNNDDVDSIFWEGDLGPFQNTAITLPFLTAISGENNILLYTSQPNGQPDDNPSNDTLSYQFYSATDELAVIIVLDNFPNETTWEVKNNQDELIASGGPYGSFSPGDTVVEFFCVIQDSCYTFTIFDSFGDGICCDWGEGSYTVKDLSTEEIFAAGGDFGSEEATAFCINPQLIVEITDTNHIACGETNTGSATASASGGTGNYSFIWSDGQTGSTASDLSGGHYSLTVDDGNVFVLKSFFIEGGEAPEAFCSDVIVYLGPNGTVTIDPSDVDGGSTDPCGIDSLYLSKDEFDCQDTGVIDIWLFAMNEAEQIDSCISEITVLDSIAPVAQCQDISVDLDSTGQAFIDASAVDNGSSDNCDSLVMSVDKGTFNCMDIGSNNVILTVEDQSGNSSTCTAEVEVQDVTAPIAECQDITVDLDSSGMATILAGYIDGGSTDNCDSLILSVDKYTFNCQETGSNEVILTVEDGSGNISTCVANVEVEDVIAPVAECQDITVELNSSGIATVTGGDINGGSSDNCDSLILSVDKDTFSCIDTGSNEVILTVEDGSGNISTCAANVEVGDLMAPVAVCQDITVQLDSNELATILVSDIDGGTTDNCDSLILSVDKDTFNCMDIGSNDVILTVEDGSGNNSTCTAEVEVQDVTAPIAECQDITVDLDSSGMATILASDIDNGSSDNCDSLLLSVNQTQFDCGDLGANLLVLTASDGSGNSSTCSAEVEVEDETAPVAECQDITVDLNSSGMANISANDVDNGSSDNCDSLMLSVNQTQFDCGDIGTNTVVLTATDGSGNSSTCTTEVEVEDVTSPIAECQDITVQLDSDGMATISASDIDNGSSDNCDSLILSVNQTQFDCGDIGTNIIVLTASDGSGNSSTCTANVEVEDVTAPVAECQDITVDLNSSGMATISASDIDNGSSDNCDSLLLSVNQTQFDCGDIGTNTVVLTASDGSGNSSTCTAEVEVEDVTAPVAACQDITVDLNSSGMATISGNDINNGSSDNCDSLLLSVNQTQFDCGDIGTNTVVLTASDVSGNSSTCTTNVEVEDVTSPIAECQDITVQLDSDGMATISASDVDNGSSDNCDSLLQSVNQTQFDCGDIGTNTVVLTATDGSGNNSTCSAEVEVEDVTVPVAECQDITVDLNSSGIATISASDINNGSSDNCDSLLLSVDQTQFDCGDIGSNTVVLTASDGSGNGSTCTANVEVEDVTVPVAECQDITVDLNSSGIATISASDIDNGSSDNCDSLMLSVDQSQFDCGDIGSNTVVLTASDGSGNSSTCTTNVEVEDVTSPIAECQDITVQLDSDGMATISASDVDNGSSDNCDSLMLSVDQSQFDCGDIGSNTVVLTASDGSGNGSTCTANVEVEDVTAPVAECQDITVDLNSSGIATISASDIDNGSSDNCDSLMLSVNQTQFDCGDIGTNTVVLTASDVSGNSSTCTANVEVEDVTVPIAECQDITVQLDSDGMATISASDIDNGSSDNCDSLLLSVNQTQFDCGDIGTNTVVLTATDGSGNSSTCTTEVEVEDVTAPVAACQDITVDLNSSGMATISASDIDNGSSDNCDSLLLSVDQSQFNCGDIGANTLVLTATDGSGNSSTCSAEVAVEDETAPIAECQDITVQLDSDGMATISASDIDNGSSDNCDSLMLSVNQTQFDCGDIGTNTVVLTATDGSGNSSTCTTEVEVEDVIAPVAACQDITVDLNSSGIATISASDIDNGSSDNCDSLMLSVDQSQFDCGDIGSNTVVLTASDGSGNSSTCTADVEVEDNIPPDISCASSVSQQVQNPGDSSVFVNVPLASATDNCGLNSIENNYNSGGADASDVFDLGTTTVIYSATDASGNSANCTTEVTVFADMSVVAVCNDISVSLDPAGMANVDAELLDGGSFGGVGELTFTVDGSSTLTFDCSDIGSDLFTLLVEDEADGADSCEAEITVMDDLPPTAVCQDITVQLDSDGIATISASDIDNGSSDNCGIETLVLSDSVFNCGAVGQQTIFLTVTDENDNSSSCTAEVTVEDNEPPEVECNDYTIALGENGEAEINTSDVLQSASDNCGIADITISQTQFNCGDVGINTVILTVTDENGNDATCIAEVTVEDNLPPTIECPSDESIEIPEGETEWFVDLAEAIASDNCGIDSVANSHNAGGSNASGTYPLGETVVVFTALDLSGNQAECTTLIEISEQDSIPSHHPISGQVQTIFGVNINNVQMVVTGDENFTDSTNSDGLYFVEVGSGNTVTMTPEKDENWLDGVSTLDLVLAQQHILNISTFDSPFLHIAADVNDDGITSTFDLVLLQQLILNITSSIAGNTSWRFIPNSYDFTDPSNPLAESFPEMVVYANVSSDKPDEDWTAVKVGDVSGDAGLSGLRQVHGDYGLRLQPVSGKNGQELIEVRADQHEWLNGFQMEFHFNPDKAKLSGVIIAESVLENFHESNFAVDHRKGHIRVIWFHGHGQDVPPGSELFTLEFKYISEHSLTNYPVLKQRGKFWHSEVYTDMGDKILNIVPVWEEARDGQSITLHQNKPNPFSDHTVIPFTSSESGTGSLEVFDLEGKTVFQRDIDVVKGENNYTLEYGNLPTGLLYYRLSIGSWSDTREMLIVR